MNTANTIAKIVYQFKPLASKIVLGSDYLVDDLLQDVSLNLLRAKSLPDNETELAKITCRAIKNCFISHTRTKSTKVRVRTQCVSTLNESFGACENEYDSKAELALALNFIETQGSKSQREAFYMYVNGFTLKEIAGKLQISIVAVSGRIFQLRKQLRKVYNAAR